METISVKEASIKWSISERSVRNYCKLGKIENASLVKGEWAIPFDAVLPNRKNANIKKNYYRLAVLSSN